MMAQQSQYFLFAYTKCGYDHFMLMFSFIEDTFLAFEHYLHTMYVDLDTAPRFFAPFNSMVLMYSLTFLYVLCSWSTME